MFLSQAKEELIRSDTYASVFMSGSGSTLVCLGAHNLEENPGFEKESPDQDWLAVLIEPVNRKQNEWYQKSTGVSDKIETGDYIEKK